MINQESSYTLILTHDVDHLALKKYPIFSKDTISFFKRCLFNNFIRLFKKDISYEKYLDSIKWCVAYPLIKAGKSEDPWEKAIADIMALEKKYEARSTFFFIPMPHNPGHKSKGVRDDDNREAKYDIQDYKSLLEEIEKEGFESGVHGIDSHIDSECARAELNLLKKVLPYKENFGLRMHWLYQPESLWRNLQEAGFLYDATCGSNEEVGFFEDQYEPFLRDGIWVFPLTIMDSTILGNWRMGLTMEESWLRIEEILEEAKEKRCVVTVNWHTDHFYVYDYWGEVYERILKKAKDDGAQIMNCIDYIKANTENKTSQRADIQVGT